MGMDLDVGAALRWLAAGTRHACGRLARGLGQAWSRAHAALRQPIGPQTAAHARFRRGQAGPSAYMLVAHARYAVRMAKDTSILERQLVDAGHLEAMLVGRVLTREARRAYDDYLRLKNALDWLRDLEPDNLVAIAMVGSDVRRAERSLLDLLRPR